MIDDRDRKLLTLLQSDASMPISALADRVALSPSACSRRVQRLREEGYICAQVVVLDRRRAGVPTTVFVLVRIGRHGPERGESLRQVVEDIPEVVEAHRLTGNFDYLLKLVLPNIEYYDVIYKHITQRIELFEVSAFVSMETLKVNTPLPTNFAT